MFIWDRVLVYNPGWLGTCCLDLANFKLMETCLPPDIHSAVTIRVWYVCCNQIVVFNIFTTLDIYHSFLVRALKPFHSYFETRCSTVIQSCVFPPPIPVNPTALTVLECWVGSNAYFLLFFFIGSRLRIFSLFFVSWILIP